ncbi:MAG: sugar-binding transcriptional regulator [Granulosicoccus sp.]
MKNNAETLDSRLSIHHDSVLASTAMLYYKEGLTQNEIAARLGVSRPTVVNHLRQAREQNIVDIRINGAAFKSSTVSRELKDKFDLQDVYIADFSPEPVDENDRIRINQHVARVGAMALHEVLKPGELVGVAWGETMQYLSENVPYRLIEKLTICQLLGAMPTPLVAAAESVSIKIATRLGANCFTLNAPAVLSSAELAEALRQEPAIKHQLQKLNGLDRAIFSVGNCDSNTPMVQLAIANKTEIKWYRKNGAVGILCGYFIDQFGNHIKGPVDDRMIGVSLDQVRNTGAGILVAGGRAKLKAIQATLNGGYVSHLITDDSVGRLLLDDASG